jgi:hypothetical protein
MAENSGRAKGGGTAVKICSKQLTTCRVASDGSNVELEFLDQSDAAVTVELPLDQAEAVIMTLPHLLARAVRRCTGNDEARYVFGLDEWSIEGAKDQDCLIATLKTTNGFEVCFGIPFEACRSFGWTLQRGADAALEGGEAGEIESAMAVASPPVKLN